MPDPSITDADAPREDGRATLRLRLIATTDVHLNLLPYDYLADRPAPGRGLASAAPLIEDLRASWPNTVLFDNGDLIQGGPMGDLAHGADGIALDGPHPAILALNRLGHDAATIGNHDVDFGLDALERAMAAARFPFVSANLVRADAPDQTLYAPFALLARRFLDDAGRRHRVVLGVTGFLPPQTALWARHHMAGRATTIDIVPAARRVVPRMRAAGADLVVALCHAGISPNGAGEVENVATGLARVPGIDAIFAGHTHGVFPGRGDFPAAASGQAPPDAVGTDALHGVPTAMGGAHASHLAVIDLTLGRQRRIWSVVGAAARAVPVRDGASEAPSRRAFERALEPVHKAALAYIRRRLAETRAPIHDFLAPLGILPGLHVVLDAQAWHLARTRPAPDRPILSAAAPPGFGAHADHLDVPAGPLTQGAIAAIYPYSNAFCALAATGASLRRWLERSAAAFAVVDGSLDDAPLLASDEPIYNLDAVAPLSYRIDLSRPPWRSGDTRDGRIRDLCHDGRPVADDDRFLVATNSYRAAGGGRFPDIGPVEGEYGPRNAEICRDFLRDAGRITPSTTPLWQLSAPRGATATFETGEGALAHLEAAKLPQGQRIEHAGAGGPGRIRIRLRF